ncbi:hypothetical protein C6I20_01230 [Aeromicrobium sp. A1-2]|nr:hypothetical protein C6I20_01230 [Aeromicrobium sp. A1-2]
MYTPPPPNHPQATTAMVLGVVGLTGFAVCVTFFVAPIAWILGRKAVKEIDASAGKYGGRSEAKAGMIMGIIGTGLLVLALAFIALMIVIAVNGGFEDGTYEYNYSSLVGILP